MHITVRGWGRDLGDTTILNASLSDAAETLDNGGYVRGKVYKRVFNGEDRRRTLVRISSSAELRLGGTYLLHVEVSRKEIAQLFFETHSGSMVRMIQAFMEEENAADRALFLAKMEQMSQQREQRAVEAEEAAGSE